jgi:DedD protein
VAHSVQDDGFHEIQLNGKQLVFLFMAATVVSVVIFLCGVLVGRGVRTERGIADASVASAADTAPQPATAPPTPAPVAGSDPTAAAPPATEDLSYFSRLEKTKAPAEQLKPAATAGPAPAPPAATSRDSAPKTVKAESKVEPKTEPKLEAKTEPKRDLKATTKPESKTETPRAAAAERAAAPEPGGQGFAVQIAALNVRSEADAIARRLSSKGYAAYVITPANGTPSVYRVRVGKFPTRREAESVAAKLQKEEQFKPWVTR